jgi:predicted Zn-dependent protease
MAYSRNQYILIAASIALFILMYFGCETKAKNIRDIEKSRILTLEVTSVQNLIIEAKRSMSANQVATIETLTQEFENDTTSKIEKLKTLSSKWYEFGHAPIAGHYAQEIAQTLKDDHSWSLAGTTYLLGLQRATDEKIRAYCKSNATKAFENAISLDPQNVDHKINLALCAVESPSKENPMQGILMLRELNTKHPDHVGVLNQLARLAIKTNQFDRAIERLNKAISIDSKNNTTICLLAQAYSASGDAAQAAKYSKLCKE